MSDVCALCVQGRRFTMGTELMKHTEREVAQEQGSKFKFTGYEVSVEDFGCTYCTFIYFTAFI